jgi:ubiquinone/menaquinone biosynthesis C-methylase UbiE
MPGEYQPFADVESRNWLQERLEVPALIEALALPDGARVLEVGCGRGVALVPLAERCRPAHLVGLDLEPQLLAIAEARLARRGVHAELVVGDVRAMPFADASFDVVIDFGTCWHVTRPADALTEVARVLAPGGRLVHETRLSQRLAHPIRSRRRTLPWGSAPALARERHAMLWASRRCGA